MKNLLVMKFGGTSMGSAERIKSSAAICAEAHRERPVAVIVSAMSKVTDMLLETLRHAEGGDETGVDRMLAALDAKHRECADALLPQPLREQTQAVLDDILNEFSCWHFLKPVVDRMRIELTTSALRTRRSPS